MLVRFRHLRRGLATARRAPAFLSYKPRDVAPKDGDLSSLHPPDQPGQRTQRRCADRVRYALQIDQRVARGEKHDWSKHKQDVIEWQIIGPKMTPGELAMRAEQAEKRWDARVGRAMDVALPHELSTKAQWDLAARVRSSTARYLRCRTLRESPSPEYEGR